jgi:hypothetical protein
MSQTSSSLVGEGMAYDLEWLREPKALSDARDAFYNGVTVDHPNLTQLLAAYHSARREHPEAVLHLAGAQLGWLRETMAELGALSPEGILDGVPAAALENNGPNEVSKAQVEATLARLDETPSERSFELVNKHPAWWEQWIEWLRGSVGGGGFLVM